MKFKGYTGLIIGILIIVVVLLFLGGKTNQTLLFLNAALMIGIPVVLGFVLSRRFKLGLGLFGIGALTFIGSQVFHIPFNQWVVNPFLEWLDLYPEPGSLDLGIAALLYGLSAGISEETARYIVYHRWLTRKRSWKEGLLFGAGHGGIEAIIFGGLAMWGFLQVVAFSNLSPETLISTLGPEKAEVMQTYLANLGDIPWYDNLLGALERVSALCIHLGATQLVLQAFNRKNIGWYFLAVLWHTAVDAFAVYGIQTWGIYLVEGVALVFGIFSLGIVFALRRKTQVSEEDIQEPSIEDTPPRILPIEQENITQEKLDDSRYE